MNNNDGKIEVECWLKNNTEWYYPQKNVDLSMYNHVELLSTSYHGDLFYAYMEDNKLNGRLFKGKWNKGKR